jgi:hypothetical protein
MVYSNDLAFAKVKRACILIMVAFFLANIADHDTQYVLRKADFGFGSLLPSNEPDQPRGLLVVGPGDPIQFVVDSSSGLKRLPS